MDQQRFQYGEQGINEMVTAAAPDPAGVGGSDLTRWRDTRNGTLDRLHALDRLNNEHIYRNIIPAIVTNLVFLCINYSFTLGASGAASQGLASQQTPTQVNR